MKKNEVKKKKESGFLSYSFIFKVYILKLIFFNSKTQLISR